MPKALAISRWLLVQRPSLLPAHRAWTTNLDQSVYGQPVVFAGRVIAVTEAEDRAGAPPRPAPRTSEDYMPERKTPLATPKDEP